MTPMNAGVPPATVVVSYVVLAYNSERYIETCVRSLASARGNRSEGDRDEIWVVDNGSGDSTPQILEALARQLPAVHLLRLPRNLGTTVSRNLALKRAAGRYLAVVDSDVEVPPGTVDALISRLDADPTCGIVVPRLEYPDGRAQISTDVFPTFQHKLRRFVMLKEMERRLPDAPEQGPKPVDYAISAFWLMRREVFEEVGPLDERIFYSPEDVDYCLRVWEAGYRVIYDTSVHATHDAQEISRQRVPTRATFSHFAGLIYLFWKHRYFFGRTALYRRIRHAVRAQSRVEAHGGSAGSF